MITRREFIKNSTITASGIALLGTPLMGTRERELHEKSTVVSAAAEDMLIGQKYNPEAVHRAFSAGLKEMTGENTLENAWSSLFSPDDVVGIKINCIGAPKISSSLESINETIAGLKSAGVKENNIIIWDRTNIVNRIGIFGWPSNYITMGVTFEYLLDFWRPPAPLSVSE